MGCGFFFPFKIYLMERKKIFCSLTRNLSESCSPKEQGSTADRWGGNLLNLWLAGLPSEKQPLQLLSLTAARSRSVPGLSTVPERETQDSQSSNPSLYPWQKMQASYLSTSHLAAKIRPCTDTNYRITSVCGSTNFRARSEIFLAKGLSHTLPTDLTSETTPLDIWQDKCAIWHPLGWKVLQECKM